MTLVSKGILATTMLLGVAEVGDVPAWATSGLLVFAFALVQWLGTRTIARLDADLTGVKAAVAANSDAIVRLISEQAHSQAEILKLRDHYHEIAKVTAGFDARLATLAHRRTDAT